MAEIAQENKEGIISNVIDTGIIALKTLPSESAYKWLGSHLTGALGKAIIPVSVLPIFAISAIANCKQENFWEETTKGFFKQAIPFAAINMLMPGATFAILGANMAYNFALPTIGGLVSNKIVILKTKLDNFYDETIDTAISKTQQVSGQAYEEIAARVEQTFGNSKQSNESSASSNSEPSNLSKALKNTLTLENCKWIITAPWNKFWEAQENTTKALDQSILDFRNSAWYKKWDNAFYSSFKIGAADGAIAPDKLEPENQRVHDIYYNKSSTPLKGFASALTTQNLGEPLAGLASKFTVSKLNPANLPHIGKLFSSLAGPLVGAAILEGGKLYLENINKESDVGKKFDDQFYVDFAQNTINSALVALATKSHPLIAIPAIAAYYLYPEADPSKPLTSFGEVAEQFGELLDMAVQAEHWVLDSTIGVVARLIGDINQSLGLPHEGEL